MRRLIPAWAGKTGPCRRSGGPTPAHPRVGGENRRFRRSYVMGFGSSPRGRGKHELLQGLRVRLRLIPAWAGKTLATRRAGTSTTAHPRVGGENEEQLFDYLDTTGSSPRGRGKRGGDDRVHCSVRLIPAWAGKTGVVVVHESSPPAHPRVGGENVSVTLPAMSVAGSSPRGRGKLGDGGCPIETDRLIPAWAGKTLRPCRTLRLARAHPRVGGENTF